MPDNFSQYSQTVDFYRRYRPGYPGQLFTLLQRKCHLKPAQVIADIGSGTGQMARLFLEQGHPVYAVEPNSDMRRAVERDLPGHPLLTTVDGTAEATTLPDQSVDVISVGNAFHWFDHARARQEFLRILAPRGWVVLTWNLRRHDGSSFADGYERFWQTHIDPSVQFERTSQRRRPGFIDRFFEPGHLQETTLENNQACDLDSLLGVVLSYLQAPQKDDPRHPAMVAELTTLFDRWQENGKVTLAYDTAVVFGQLQK